MRVLATPKDLEARWRTLTNEEESVAETLLSDAQNMIAMLLATKGKSLEAYADNEVYAETAKAIICAVVKRSMAAGDDVMGLSQHSMTAGSFNESFSFANPSGDMYLTANEKKMLGIAGMNTWSIKPMIGARDEG